MSANKTVLITGCSSGIGRELALAMRDRGYNVYGSGRSIQKLKPLADEGIKTLELDVTDKESIAKAIAQVAANGDNIDIVVNNAGYGAMGPLLEMPAAELETQFNTNVYGILYTTQACFPHLVKSEAGLVVNIGSVSGLLVTPFSGAYCASKAAVHALSDALRMELAPFGVRVMIVQPGAIESEFGNNAEASLARTFSDDSIYLPVKSGLFKRAQMSQQNPTPAKEFAQLLLKEIEPKRPATRVRIGNGSRAATLMSRYLPTAIKDRLLRRAFSLDRELK